MTKSIDPKLVGARVRAARTEINFTQTDLGEYLGIGQTAIAKLERGDSSLTLENLVKLSEVSGKSVLYFLGMGTGDLSAEEAELVEVFRSIPPGDLKDNLLNVAKTTAQQARAAEKKPSMLGRQEVWQSISNMTPEEREEFGELIYRLNQDDVVERRGGGVDIEGGLAIEGSS